MRVLGVMVLAIMAAAALRAQTAVSVTPEEMARQRQMVERGNNAEHQRELDLLHLSATRPGVDGNGKGDKPVNYDEAKAGVTDANVLQPGTLPAVLTFADGRPVRTAKDWARRRTELLRTFDAVELGVTPAVTPEVTWRVVSNTVGPRDWTDATGTAQHAAGRTMMVRTKVLRGQLAHPDDPTIPVNIDLLLVTPVTTPGMHVPKGVPVVMEFSYHFPASFKMPVSLNTPGPSWQDQVLQRGWGYAEYQPYSVQPDNAAGLTAGVIGLTNHGKPRGVGDWGALKAWGWGASRALDYLATDADVDAQHVAIEGHSRFGKAALVTMAYDTRFAAGFLSSSGAGGVNLWRRTYGEQLENVEAPGEFHWEAGNLLKYAADPLHATDLPMDQHELLALCAPRLTFVSAGSVLTTPGTVGDQWVDAHGMFLSAVAASPVWVLLGSKGLSDAAGPVVRFPTVETGLMGGRLAFRQHTLGHTPGPNWPTFLDFVAAEFDSGAQR